METLKKLEIKKLESSKFYGSIMNMGDGEFSINFEPKYFEKIDVSPEIESIVLSVLDSEYLFNIENEFTFYKHKNHSDGDSYVLSFNGSYFEFHIRSKSNEFVNIER